MLCCLVPLLPLICNYCAWYCAAAGLLGTIAAGCPIIACLLQQQRQQQQQQQTKTGQPLDKQEQDDLCTTLLQLAACHLNLWSILASNTHHSIGSSSSSSTMRSILSTPLLLQTVQPAARLAAELLLWTGIDGRPCWEVPLKVVEQVFCALRIEIRAEAIAEHQAANSSSSSSSGSDRQAARGAAAAAHSLSSTVGTQAPGRPWVQQ
jgi:hypothetical protein